MITKIYQKESLYNNTQNLTCKICILTFFIILLSILLVILLILGIYVHKQQQSKVLTYIQDICQVQNINYEPYSCPSRYTSDQCYLIKWKVKYGDKQIIHSIIIEYNFNRLSDVYQRTDQYQINASYACWYDTKHPLQVQWEQPNIRVAIILIISSGLLIIPIFIFIYTAIKYWKLEKQQQQQHVILWMELKENSI